jgi:hypothetical protein
MTLCDQVAWVLAERHQIAVWSARGPGWPVEPTSGLFQVRAFGGSAVVLIRPLPLNTRHAGPRQVTVGPGALRQLICDTTKVNKGAAETTRTDQQAARLRDRAAVTTPTWSPRGCLVPRRRSRDPSCRVRMLAAPGQRLREDPTPPARDASGSAGTAASSLRTMRRANALVTVVA